MRLGYLVPEFPGVTHVIFWREMRRLREAGVEVRLLSTRRPAAVPPHDFADEPCAYTWPPSLAIWRGVPPLGRLLAQLRFALSLPEGGWRERLRVLALLPSSWMLTAEMRRRKVQHLHVQSFANAAYLGALAHLGSGVPYSPVLHGGISVYGLNHAAKLRHAAFACGVAAGPRRQIEAVSPGVVLDEDIQCGVDLDLFSPAPRPEGGPLRLISVGRMDHCKGIGFALEAIASLPDRAIVRYTLIGSGPHEAEILAHAHRLGLDDIVTHLGARGQREIVDALRSHHVAVLTSVGEGEVTATAIREAMATGMPVIMSRIGEAAAMITEGDEGKLVPQKDVGAIADAIRWCAEHRHELARMGAAARHRAESDFSDRIGPSRLTAAIARRLQTEPDAATALGSLPSRQGA